MDAFLELFSSEGRANRAWYFWHVLLDDLVIITAFIILMVVGVATESALVFLPMIGVVIAGLWAAIAITVKRLHDINRPGWHWFLLIIPIYNIVLGLQLLFQRGTDGANQFGHDPLRVQAASAHLLD
jgi:uncharacterized membrane protein YhaH (DUF805 family)